MKLLFFLIIFIFFCQRSYSEEIKIIELDDQNIDQGLIKSIEAEELSQDTPTVENKTDEELNTSESKTILNESEIIVEEDEIDNEITSLPDYWENADKDEIIFLFENMKPSYSNVLNDTLVEILKYNSKSPKNFNEDDFNYLKIDSLIKLNERKEAFNMINLFNNNEKHLNFYNVFKLNYYFSIYDLNQACDFANSNDIKDLDINKNYLLKVDIFCSFIQNKINEADFLNSLLQDTNDNDSYFQKIFLNLKNSDNSLININSYELDQNLLPLYSAMIRVGDMPLSQKFLDYDSDNLSEPIILSRSSDISLRLSASHKAYMKKKFNAESLSALYQTVDFSSEELNNYDEMIKKLKNKPEICMAFLFQRATIQILPITRIQALLDFWNFAEQNDLDILAYDVSQKFINTIEPSSELSEFGISIARAHIYNNNFDLADEWILFSENYLSDESNYEEEMESLKLLYNLKNSNNDNEFNNILIANLYQLDSFLYKKINNNIDKQEILLTVLSAINENFETSLSKNRKLVDKREMPSRYLINKIKYSYKSKNYGELILSIIISMTDKNWNEVHPEHLRIILSSLQDNLTEGIFREIILEILKETKII